jgi:hypothetical protein
MHFGKVVILASAVALVCACGHPDQEYVDAVPDMSQVGLEIRGGTAEGFASASSTSGLQAEGDLAMVTQELGTLPEYLQHARAGIRELNEHVRQILEPIVSTIRSDAARMEPGQVRTWTRDRDGITFKLSVKKIAAGRFGWRVEAKPTGGEDSAYKVVMAGGIARDLANNRGRGFLAVDLDTYKLVNTAFTGQGKLLAGYSHAGDSKTVAYFLKEFTPNLANHEPVTAAFVGHRIASTGLTGVKMVARVNLANAGATPTDAKELVRIRVRYLPSVGGRGDLFATGGDIAEGVWYYGVGCWNASEEETFKALFRCTRTSTGTPACEIVNRVGERTACAVDLGGGDDINRQPTDNLMDSAPVLDGAPDLQPPADSLSSAEAAPQ